MQSLQRSPRSPELDGLRGIAILIVLGFHLGYVGVIALMGGPSAWTAILGLGWSGVDLFFVLSGFLLGGILIDNRDASNLFRVFYARRACRILPLYYLVVGGILFTASPVLVPGGVER